jgi:hypothetical protein
MSQLRNSRFFNKFKYLLAVFLCFNIFYKRKRNLHLSFTFSIIVLVLNRKKRFVHSSKNDTLIIKNNIIDQ